MFFLEFSNPEVQAAVISGFFSVLSALIAAIAAAWIGKTISNRQRLEETLKMAIDDIEFMLEVEELHCEHNARTGESRKNTVRKQAREVGLDFSGRFTPGRVNASRFLSSIIKDGSRGR